ncbi:putative MFS family arabinose efflux permease [Mumia flava]|uniref:Putative MFS family arabinose efflux permease n=1 Tax=Mumia flava TaxID=1348852 RepID=A0A2M9BET9_9ACTN|nr:MFS transporter [Mumia flava]PJJ56467.1 putative MFS family arabinose efflux permease [Mumia flava]
MTDTRPLDPGAPPHGGPLPWAPLLVLAGATLVMVTAEMLPTAVLDSLSDSLGVSEARTGRLVSLWAGVVVVASLPLARLARRWQPRDVVVTSLVLLAASSLASALAPTYGTAAAARVVGAMAVGVLWATVNAHVADLVDDRQLASAVAVVLGGATAGMVVGTPGARIVADHLGWRAAFVALAAATLLVALLVRLVVAPGRSATAPADGAAPADEARAGARGGRPQRSVRPVLVLTGWLALALAGHYGAYTFITRLTNDLAGLPGGTGTVLLVFGVTSAAGIALAARAGRHTRTGLVVAVSATAGALAALPLVGVGPAVGLLVVAAWGLSSGSLPALAQTEILRRAGTEHRAFAGALIPVVFNGGIAVGAALAADVVARSGPNAVPPLAAGLVAVAAVGLALPRLALSRRSRLPRDGVADARRSGVARDSRHRVRG